MKKIGWMWLAGLAFASSVQAQKIEEVLQSVEQNNKELQAVFHSTEAAKMEVQTQNNLEDPSVEYSPFFAKGIDGMASSELVVTQGDIRQVQLAKGAILSGFLALLNKAGISMKELDKVMIAGQFGAHLPSESLTGTGILPKEVEDKIIYVGNSSKTGAYMTLLSEQVKEEMEGLAERMEYIELAETENYEKIFAESMRFV